MLFKTLRYLFSNLCENNLVETYREHGFAGIARDFLYTFASNSIIHFRVYEIIRREQAAHYPLTAQENQIQKATLADARFLSACGYSTAILREWLQQGIEGWYVAHEGNLLGCTWIDISHSYNLCQWLVLQTTSESAWIHWWWVEPTYRGKGAAYRISPYPQGLDICRMAVIDSFNRRALRGAYKLGWVSVNRLIILQLYKLKFVWFKGRLSIGRWKAETPLKFITG